MADSISAIVPARDEERNIGACVESLLPQSGLAEILVADDDSTDGTAAVVRALAARDARVRLVTVPPLPPGWVGKNHALAQAARLATSEWLLFTDADTLHAAGSLRAALDRAGSAGCDMLSLSPAQELRSWYEKAVIPRVYRELERLFRFDEINDPRLPAAAANGQFILVRRAVYESLGGHAALGGEILEDVALARKVKQAGYRLHFSSGAELVRTRMYSSLSGLWQGWTKNLFLLYGRRAGRLAGTAAWIWLLDVLPVAAAAWKPKLAAPAALWLFARHALYARRLRRAGEDPRLALYYWPGSLLFSLLLLNSLARHALGRRLAWKGREYPVAAAGAAGSQR